MLAIRLQYAAGNRGAYAMAKKRKTAAKKAAKKPAKRAPKRGGASSVDMDTTVNALVILVVIAIAIAGVYMYMQKAKADPALIDVSPISVSIAPR
jgi:uncharacterized protein HemX